jgi:hypothetical protein
MKVFITLGAEGLVCLLHFTNPHLIHMACPYNMRDDIPYRADGRRTFDLNNNLELIDCRYFTDYVIIMFAYNKFYLK